MNRKARRVWLLPLGALAAGSLIWWLLTPRIHPERYDVRVERFTLDSELVGRSLDQTIVLPRGETSDLPVLFLLHGRGSSPDGMLSDQLFAALEHQGSMAPVVVLANGGEASYFHDRQDGEWGSYLMKELLPEIADRWDVDTSRVAIGGISMGGFGALDQARLAPDRYCAVGAHSPAIFESAGETPEGAFDDAEDFTRHDVLGAVMRSPETYKGVPLWIDVGDDDPFRATVQRFAQDLKEDGSEIEVNVWPGDHNESYWWSHIDDYIVFYSQALEKCAPSSTGGK